MLGICVSIGAARPGVSCVVLIGTRSNPQVDVFFDLKAGPGKIPHQLQELAKALRSKLTALSLDHAVIRLADPARVGNRRGGSRDRLLVEGALALACEGEISGEVFLRTGGEIQRELGLSKSETEAAGAELDHKRYWAAAAALSALPDES